MNCRTHEHRHFERTLRSTDTIPGPRLAEGRFSTRHTACARPPRAPALRGPAAGESVRAIVGRSPGCWSRPPRLTPGVVRNEREAHSAGKRVTAESRTRRKAAREEKREQSRNNSVVPRAATLGAPRERRRRGSRREIGVRAARRRDRTCRAAPLRGLAALFPPSVSRSRARVSRNPAATHRRVRLSLSRSLWRPARADRVSESTNRRGPARVVRVLAPPPRSGVPRPRRRPVVSCRARRARAVAVPLRALGTHARTHARALARALTPTTSEQARSPAEFKHIIKRRKRN